MCEKSRVQIPTNGNFLVLRWTRTRKFPSFQVTKKTSRNNSEEDESKEDDQNFLSDEDNGQEVTGYFTEEGIRKIQNHWRSLQCSDRC